MEHSEAVRLRAAEKYLLGELSSAQREEYEEHYFDCPACAEELKATVAFMESAKQVAREHAPRAVADKTPAGWFNWMRPAFAVPVFATLLLLALVGYQNLVTIPSLKQLSTQIASAKIVNSVSLMEAGARGETAVNIKVRQDEDFALEVDFPPVASATSYVGKIQDDAGHTRFALPVTLEQSKSTVHVNVPGGSLQPGKYNFVILAAQGLDAAAGLKEIKMLPFTVEFRQ